MRYSENFQGLFSCQTQVDLTVLLRKRKKPGNCFKKNLLAIAGAINSIHK